MLTQMVDGLIQQDPTLLARRTADTRKYIADQWNRTHDEPIDEDTRWHCSSVTKRALSSPRSRGPSPKRNGLRCGTATAKRCSESSCAGR